MTTKSVPGVPFPKGKSGNPGGRPKENPEVKELAKAHTAAAIERLAYWMMSDEPRASVAAANALLDRAWGKPIQAVSGPEGGPIQVQQMDAIDRPEKETREEWLARRRRELGGVAPLGATAWPTD